MICTLSSSCCRFVHGTRKVEAVCGCSDEGKFKSAEAECLHYLGNTPSWKGLVRQLVQRDYCDGNDSLVQDEILLRSMQSSDSGER